MHPRYGKGNEWLIELLRSICNERGISLRLLSEGWLLELEKSGYTSRTLGYTFDLNSAAASSIGRDKVATYELLKAYNVSAIPHSLIRINRRGEWWNELAWEAGIVVKPLTGKGGQNVRLFYSASPARAFMYRQKIEAWALSPLADIVREIRFIMLDGTPLYVYEKKPVRLSGLRVFNLSKGATPLDYKPTPGQVRLAQETQRVLGLRLAAIDIVELASGQQLVLEVNSAVTMKEYLTHTSRRSEVARKVYEPIIDAMFFSPLTK
jgi:glutathione synthase/RimK-type ligase-like ATP-grasp enzyme